MTPTLRIVRDLILALTLAAPFAAALMHLSHPPAASFPAGATPLHKTAVNGLMAGLPPLVAEARR